MPNTTAGRPDEATRRWVSSEARASTHAASSALDACSENSARRRPPAPASVSDQRRGPHAARRGAGARGAWVGVGASAATLAYVKFATDLHPLGYAGVGVGVCCAAGLVASAVLPAPARMEVTS